MWGTVKGAVAPPPAPQYKNPSDAEKCVADNPALRYVAPLSLVSLANMKTPSEWRPGASKWTSVDRRIPDFSRADIESGMPVGRGTLGRTKFIGRLGTIAMFISAVSTVYTFSTVADCAVKQ